jgi:hypothetical protein
MPIFPGSWFGCGVDRNLVNISALHQVTMVFPVADVLRARGVPFVFATGYERLRLTAASPRLLTESDAHPAAAGPTHPRTR